MKKQLTITVLILLLASLACSIQNFQMETMETQYLCVSEALPGNIDETELVFKMTGGEFILTPGGDGLVNGTITYNVEQWEPQFTRRDNFYEIKQVNPFRFSGLPNANVENTWDLSLTNRLPLRLSIEGGASENTFDFSGLQLTSLKIIQGASDTTIRFDTPNPLLMEQFTFTTGASSAKLFGLGHANFKQMTMSGGAGDYTLDFSGALSQDSIVDIKAGISNISIIIPSGMRAVIHNQGTVSNINTSGTWLLTDDTYTTLVEGHTLTINLDLAIGNVNLVQEQ
jgi:hypothetical protein